MHVWIKLPQTLHNFPYSLDYLEIADENNATVDTFCGDETGKEVLVGGNYAVLRFVSDPSMGEKGFEISFKAAKPSKCNHKQDNRVWGYSGF